MAAMELTMMYVIAGGLFLLTIVLMFMLKNIMDKVSDLEDANDGVLSKLNISQKKGEAGEQLVASVTGDLIDAGILEQDVSLPDNKSMDFASVIGTSEDGGTIYLPIDSKVNKAPTKVLTEIKKYIGRSYGDGIRTTPFAVIAYPDDEEAKYRKYRADAKKESVFFVRLSTLSPYLLFIRWYNDNIAPLQSANSKIAEALIVFRNHHAMVEKQAYEVHQKLESLGARLEKGMTEAAQEAGLPMTFQRSGSMFCGYFGDHTVRNLSDAMACDRDRFKPYFHAMLENGVYVAPSAFEAGFISAAHTFEDIDATVEAARKALKHAA